MKHQKFTDVCSKTDGSVEQMHLHTERICRNSLPALKAAWTRGIFLSVLLVKNEWGGRLNAANSDYSYLSPHTQTRTHTPLTHTQTQIFQPLEAKEWESVKSIRISEDRWAATFTKCSYLKNQARNVTFGISAKGITFIMFSSLINKCINRLFFSVQSDKKCIQA